MAASATTSPAATEASSSRSCSSCSGVRSCSDIGAPHGVDSGNKRRYSSVDSVGSGNLRARQLHTGTKQEQGLLTSQGHALRGLNTNHGERPWLRPLWAAFSYLFRPAPPAGEGVMLHQR